MKLIKIGEFDPPIRALTTAIAVVATTMLMAACASSDSGAVKKFLSGENLGKKNSEELSADFFRKAAYCPPVVVKTGTEALIIYESGQEAEPSFVEHQASITRTARECAAVAEGLSIKLGIAGRLVSGPKGGPGTLSMPVRIAVSKQGGSVLYSELYKVPVTLTSPNLSVDFSQVFQQVEIPVGPDERDLVIYVGFDEGKPG